MKLRAGIAAFLMIWTVGWVRFPQRILNEPQYLNPVPGAERVSPGTTITLRTGDLVARDSISDQQFNITASQSGAHPGHAILADDGKTVIFKPDQPFVPGEVVEVTIHEGITQVDGQIFSGKSFQFSISSGQLSAGESSSSAGSLEFGGEKLAKPDFNIASVVQNPPHYRTVPDDFPVIGILTPANGTAEGYLFLASFAWIFPPTAESPVPYLLILDNNGEPVYYKRLEQSQGGIVADFKKQPNGLLTYYDPSVGYYLAMDDHYQVVDSYRAGNGYPTTDLHELLLLPNGNALLTIYDTQVTDMSRVVSGGNPAAQVIGLVIQELDASKNVIFEWRSWDHFQLMDSSEDLTRPTIDYVHGNAIEVDDDNNLLISSRNLDEITKINRQTGNIIWRLGGKRNQFTFLNGIPQFFEQHDIRRLPNGHITLFNNRADHVSVYSAAEEYVLNENNKTISLFWQFRNTPDVYSLAMGDVQRLPNNNSLIGWGSGFPTLTEVKANGLKALEMTLAGPNVTYRAFRFPWHGAPATSPDLVVETEGKTRTLYFSWNGATEVASYRLYGGSSEGNLSLLATRTKTGFETSQTIADPLLIQCYYQVVPLDQQGTAMTASEVVYSGEPCNHAQFLPLVITQ
jgi:hypothetical protein